VLELRTTRPPPRKAATSVLDRDDRVEDLEAQVLALHACAMP